MTLQSHPLADLFPLMEGPEFAGSDPHEFVADKNLHRRHLKESQRALIGAEMANLKVGRPVEFAKENEIGGITPISSARAAKIMNVNRSTVTADVFRDGSLSDEKPDCDNRADDQGCECGISGQEHEGIELAEPGQRCRRFPIAQGGGTHMSAYTQGPWSQRSGEIFGLEGKIAMFWTLPAIADLNLILAAPDMYEALKTIEEWQAVALPGTDAWCEAGNAALEKLRVALVKAKGHNP